MYEHTLFWLILKDEEYRWIGRLDTLPPELKNKQQDLETLLFKYSNTICELEEQLREGF